MGSVGLEGQCVGVARRDWRSKVAVVAMLCCVANLATWKRAAGIEAYRRAFWYARCAIQSHRVLPNLFGAAIEMLELFKKRRTTVGVVTASATRDAKKNGAWGKGGGSMRLQLKLWQVVCWCGRWCGWSCGQDVAGVLPMEVGGKSKLGSWQFFPPFFLPLFVQVGGEKTAQHPVCVVCRRPLIFGMLGFDGIMFEQENEPLPTVVDESSFLAAQFLSLQCRRYLSLCLGGNVSRRSTVSRCTYRIHFKGLIPFDVLASSQVSFILGFGGRSKIAEFAGHWKKR